MALLIADRVRENTSTTGTGTVSLGGASSGFQSFVAEIGDGNETIYMILGSTEWEIGRGTVTDATPDTLSRDEVYSNSLGTTALVNFSAGTKTCVCVSAAKAQMFGILRGARITATAFSVADVTEVTVDFGTEDYDTDTLATLGTNADRFTIPASWADFYVQCGVYVKIAAALACDVLVRIEQYNSANALQDSWETGFLAATTNPDAAGQAVTPPVQVASGDYFTVVVRHNDGAARNVDADFWLECKGIV